MYVVPVEERVVPSKARPLPIASDLMPPMFVPTRMPPSGVVLPVPPKACESEVVALTMPLIA